MGRKRRRKRLRKKAKAEKKAEQDAVGKDVVLNARGRRNYWKWSHHHYKTKKEFMEEENWIKIFAKKHDRIFGLQLTKNTLILKLPMWADYADAIISAGEKKAEKWQRKNRKQKKPFELAHKHESLWWYLKPYFVEREKFVLKPALIVGYGPSFHKNLHRFKEIDRDKCTIIATDRAVRKLLEIGVVPHIVTNLDSGDQIKPFYDRDMPWDKMIAMFALTTNPHSREWIPADKIYWYNPAVYPWENNFSCEISDRTGISSLPTAGNIGTTSMLLAFCLGCAPIFLIGMDFGYELEEGEMADLDDSRAKIFESPKTGRKYRTDDTLMAYKIATERILAQSLYSPELRARPVVNISEGLLHGDYMLSADFDGFLKALKVFKEEDRIKEFEQRTKDGSIKLMYRSFKQGRNVARGMDDEIKIMEELGYYEDELKEEFLKEEQERRDGVKPRPSRNAKKSTKGYFV